MDASTLPTTVIGLIAFITALDIGAVVWVVKYFLSAQRKQTEIYMDYIQNKNGYLESQRDDFGKMLQVQGDRHDAMLREYANRLEVCQAQKS